MKRTILVFFSLVALLCLCSCSSSTSELKTPPEIPFTPEELITINNTLSIDPNFLSEIGLFREKALKQYSYKQSTDNSWHIHVSYDGMTFEEVCADVESMNLDIHLGPHLASYVGENLVKYSGYIYTRDIVNVVYFYEILWNTSDDIGEGVKFGFGFEMA